MGYLIFILTTKAKIITMALPLLPTATILWHNSTSLTSMTSFTPSLLRKKSQKPSLLTKPNRVFICKAENNRNDQNHDIMGKLDRRDMLIGLGAGGLSAAGLETNPFAFAAPVPAPDISSCGLADKPDGTTIDCCPPNTTIIDFTLPKNPILRTRPAAQNIKTNSEYLRNFKKGIELMKALPKDDPRSFAQQAMVHCAYCNDGYPMPGFPNLKIQVHYGWLFFPFHRWYLYFFEKIIGKLINDPTFALPFWNWDAPAGMYLPSIFTDTTSPLYDKYRNAAHQPPKLLDLNYSGSDDTTDDKTRIIENLTTMYVQMVSNGISPRLFFGDPYRAGDPPHQGAGSIERVPHNTIHDWTGDPTQPNGEDMGTFYSAGRDPVFYSHHSNVDRMWSIYKSLGGTEIKNTDWLDAKFLFYDENKNLVRVKVRDSLDESKLGYKYEDVEIPWRRSKPTARKSKNKRKATVSSSDLKSKFPTTLTNIISVEVSRPSAVKRTTAEKAAEVEVLVISGIEFDGSKSLKFDVYVNDDADTLCGRDKAEFAGSFVHVSHRAMGNIKTNLRLALTNLLEEVEAEQDSSVVVTLVPKYGKGPITIGGLKIELISTTI